VIGSNLLLAAAAFGIVAGQPLPKGAVQKKYDPSLYTVRPPQPNAYFSYYVAKSTPQTGVCQIWAETPSAVDDSGLMAKFNEIKSTLASLYGSPEPMTPKETSVFLRYGMDAAWGGGGRRLPPGITDILLVKDVEPYTITVIYTFSNWRACKAASVPAHRKQGL